MSGPDRPRDRRGDAILDRLRSGGGRVTAARRLVVDALLDAPDHHVVAAEVVQAVRERSPGFPESSVYRTLDRLAELGELERVQVGPGAAVFHLPHRAHHHAVCDGCGRVIETPVDLLDGAADRLRDEQGFVLRSAAVTLHGRCRGCSVSEPRPPAPARAGRPGPGPPAT